ncbi:hypothetical protein MFUR16E_04725 [Methylobacterium fujisawaense]|uniref:phage tail sheath subtilisin-like domain-containing protein n=1 Tax=Methylobacterium fujisawaense TaxID=107400 RepID=UPI002F31D566
MAASQVAFNYVPGDSRVPMFLAELNAGPPAYSGLSPQLIIAPCKTGSAAALFGKPYNAGGTDPNIVCGAGSIAAEMLLYARQRNPIGQIFVLDRGAVTSGSAAAGSVAFAGTATAGGTVTRYINGERYDANVALGDTAAVVAAAFAARVAKGYTKFNQLMAAPVTAAVTAGGTATATSVGLTANHPGTEGNAISVLAGLDGDESEVPGITLTVTPLTGGVGDADMAALLAKLGNSPFDFICAPYSTTAQLNAVRDFLAITGSGRASPMVGLDGHYFTAMSGNLSALTTFGAGRNDPHVTIIGINSVPQAPWVWAASLGGEVAMRKNLGRPLKQAIEIVRPMQNLVQAGLRPPLDPANDFDPTDQQSLLSTGISTWYRTADNEVALQRIITTYQTNAAGLPDIGFLDVEKVFGGVYVKRFMKNALLGAYPRSSMMEDNPQSIQGVVTPPQATACVIHAYEKLHGAGIVRQPDLFAQNVIVEFDYDNDRANFYLPVAVTAALRIFAVNETLFSDLTDASGF